MESSHESFPDALESPLRDNEHLSGVYDDLRRLARAYLRDEPVNHTLQPTALAHEAYMRLDEYRGCRGLNRAQFLTAAARTMRYVLIDHARRRHSIKRRAYEDRVSLDDVAEPTACRDRYLVALDDALRALAGFDRSLARIVELRFFGGLTVSETADILGVAPITVKRRWKLARGWLHREIMHDDSEAIEGSP